MLKLFIAAAVLAVVAAQKSKYCEIIEKVDCAKYDQLDAHLGPHCATNGVSYNSSCEKAKAECKLGKPLHTVFHGHCDDKPTLPPILDKCSDVHIETFVQCGEDSQPVCGSDSKTYKNRCEFHKARCADKAKFGVANAPQVYVKVYGTTCEDIPTRPPPRDPCTEYWLKQDCSTSRVSFFTKVCDQNQNAYDNRCYFYQAYCKDNTIRQSFCKLGPKPTTDGSGEKPE